MVGHVTSLVLGELVLFLCAVILQHCVPIVQCLMHYITYHVPRVAHNSNEMKQSLNNDYIEWGSWQIL